MMDWLIIGAIVGIGGYWFVGWLNRRKIRLTWYEWLIAAVALALTLLAYQNFTASFSELEPRGAWVLLLLFGFPALFFAVLDWRLVLRHKV